MLMRISTESTPPFAPITQEALAARCGVSLSAVSLALQGKGRLGKATRARILAAAHEMGYVPSRAAQQMAARRWAGRGEVCEGLNLAWLYSSAAPFTKAAERERKAFLELCKPHGHGTTVIHVDSFRRAETWWQQLRARGVEGVLLGPGLSAETVDLPAIASTWPTVTYYPQSQDVGGFCHEVREDHYGRILRAVQWVRKFGYGRVGFALLEHDPPLDDDYLRRGALHYLPTRFPDMHFCPTLFYPPRLHPDFGEIQMRVAKWFREHRPEVVVGMNAAVYFALVEAGVKIPEEVGFLNFNLADAYDQTARLTLQLSGFLRERVRLLASALHLLEEVIARPSPPDTPPVRLLIEAAPVVGESLRQKG